LGLSSEVGLPEYGVLLGLKVFFSPEDSPLKLLLGLSSEDDLPRLDVLPPELRPVERLSPESGLPEYGLRFTGPKLFWSFDVSFPWLLRLGFSPAGSEPEVEDFLNRVAPDLLIGSSPLKLLFGDRLDLSSRLFPGLLNTIIFCFALPLREGQS
jgi:hypothetical protein